MRDMMPLHMTEYTIGMDLGGTNLRAAAIDQSGTLLEKVAGATKFEEGREAVGVQEPDDRQDRGQRCHRRHRRQ